MASTCTLTLPPPRTSPWSHEAARQASGQRKVQVQLAVQLLGHIVISFADGELSTGGLRESLGSEAPRRAGSEHSHADLICRPGLVSRTHCPIYVVQVSPDVVCEYPAQMRRSKDPEDEMMISCVGVSTLADAPARTGTQRILRKWTGERGFLFQIPSKSTYGLDLSISIHRPGRP